MTDRQETTRESGRAPFDVASCGAMMERMMQERGWAADCAELFSGSTGSKATGRGCCDATSWVMATCCGERDEAEAATVGEAPPSG